MKDYQLFDPDRQHQPGAMLADLVTVYARIYGLEESEALRQIRRDALEAIRARTRYERDQETYYGGLADAASY